MHSFFGIFLFDTNYYYLTILVPQIWVRNLAQRK